MRKTVKFAVSISFWEFKEMESLRKKLGLTRSAFIRETFRLWKEAKKTEKLLQAYEEGYRKIPENPVIIEAWEKTSLSSFNPEEW